MTRPARRLSSLSGESPVAPAQPAEPAARPVAEATTPRVTNAAAPSSRTGAGEKQPKKYPPKVSFYQDPDDTTRLRAAYRHSLAHTTDRSLSDFISRVVMAEVQRLENEYNGGQPFPSVGAGELPQGRPVGE